MMLKNLYWIKKQKEVDNDGNAEQTEQSRAEQKQNRSTSSAETEQTNRVIMVVCITVNHDCILCQRHLLIQLSVLKSSCSYWSMLLCYHTLKDDEEPNKGFH